MKLYKLLLVAALILFVVPTYVFADSKDIFPIYTSTTDPLDTEVPAAPWIEYTGGTINVESGNPLWIGVDNLYVSYQIKRLELTLTGNSLGDLTIDDLKGYISGGDTTKAWLVNVYPSGNTVKYIFGFDPQPDWEVILFVNGGAGQVQISDMVMYSTCRRVPSLTQWGVIALVIMLMAATYYVYRRKTATA